MRNKLTDFWTVDCSKYSIKDTSMLESMSEKDKSEVDGKYIIGVVEGPMFVPDGKSRNDRFYPRTLWDKVLEKEDTKTRLRDRLMFGSIGHKEEPFSDEDLRNGEASHIITDMWIDETTGLGCGRALILGTETGKNLLIYLKAKSKLRTSTRAFGEYKEGVNHEGLPVVDEDTYDFFTIDFVIDPGFLQAKPTLKENFSKTIKENKNMANGSDVMSEAIRQLRVRSSQDAKAINSLKTENAKLKSALSKMTQQSKLESAKSAKMLGDSSKVMESLKALKIGNVQVCLEALSKLGGRDFVNFVIANKVKLETLQGLKKLMASKCEGNVNMSNLHKVLSSKSEQKDKIIAKYRELGSVSEVSKLCDVVEQYNKLGSIKDLTTVLGESKKRLLAAKNKKMNAASEALAKQCGQPVESVRRVVSKMGITEARRIFKAQPKKSVSEPKKTVKSESVSRASSFFESMSSRG